MTTISIRDMAHEFLNMTEEEYKNFVEDKFAGYILKDLSDNFTAEMPVEFEYLKDIFNSVNLKDNCRYVLDYADILVVPDIANYWI